MPNAVLVRLIPGVVRAGEGPVIGAVILPFLVEMNRRLLEPSLGKYLGWLPIAGQWAVVCLAFAAQTQLRSTNYDLWWSASVLAILLTFRDRQSLTSIITGFAAYAAFLFFLVHPVQASAESPFGYVFALPLLFSQESLFGSSKLGKEVAQRVLQGFFFFIVFVAYLAPMVGADARRVFLGFAIVLLVLLLRSCRIPPAMLVVIFPLPWLAAQLLGSTLLAKPLLLLTYYPLILLAVSVRAKDV